MTRLAGSKGVGLSTIAEDGSLQGLPEQYGPASIVVRRGLDSDPPSVIIRLGERRVRLPRCMARLFELPPGERIKKLQLKPVLDMACERAEAERLRNGP